MDMSVYRNASSLCAEVVGDKRRTKTLTMTFEILSVRGIGRHWIPLDVVMVRRAGSIKRMCLVLNRTTAMSVGEFQGGYFVLGKGVAWVGGRQDGKIFN